jgi:hypothetical protein
VKGQLAPERPEFDDEGNLSNVHHDFQRRGFVKGAQITSTVEVVLAGRRKRSVIGERTVGDIVASESSGITVSFPALEPVTWPWFSFPRESFVVTKVPDQKTTTNHFDDVAAYALARSPAFEAAHNKAQMLMALHGIWLALEETKEYMTVRNCGDAYPVRLQMRPKLAFAAVAIPAEKPLALAPMTLSFGECASTSSGFLKTTHPHHGDGSACMSLQQCFCDPLNAIQAAGKVGVLEPFWFVRHCEEEHGCNMRLKEHEVTLACSTGGFGVGQNKARPQGKLAVPLIVTTKAVDAGQELVLFYQETGDRPLKKVKLS